MKVSRISELFIRYILLILLAFQNLFIFSFIFSPATIYPVFFLIKLFFNVYLMKSRNLIKPRVPRSTRTPAIKAPRAIDKILFFLSNPRNHEIRQPVQTPVPGRGTPTNKA